MRKKGFGASTIRIIAWIVSIEAFLVALSVFVGVPAWTLNLAAWLILMTSITLALETFEGKINLNAVMSDSSGPIQLGVSAVGGIFAVMLFMGEAIQPGSPAAWLYGFIMAIHGVLILRELMYG